MSAGANCSILLPECEVVEFRPLSLDFDSYGDDGRVTVLQVLYRGLTCSWANVRLNGHVSGRTQWMDLAPCPDTPPWSWSQATVVMNDRVLRPTGNKIDFLPSDEAYWIGHVLVFHGRPADMSAPQNIVELALR